MNRLQAVCTAGGLLALAAVELSGTQARAEVIYPWCLTVYFGPFDAVENCGFVSYEQCKMSMVARDTCSPNYAYFVSRQGKAAVDPLRSGALPPIRR